MPADNYTRDTRVHKSEDISSNAMWMETNLRKHDDICNPNAPKRTSDMDENIEIEVKTVVNSLVNTVVGILDGDGEILDNDNEQEEEQGSKRVTSGEGEGEGEVVSDTNASGRASEESLSRKHKFCLDLYRKHRQLVDTNAAVLKQWQKLLMTELEKSHARRVVWVIGRSGNEGKTWLQNYIESLYCYERVGV